MHVYLLKVQNWKSPCCYAKEIAQICDAFWASKRKHATLTTSVLDDTIVVLHSGPDKTRLFLSMLEQFK